MKTSFFVKAAVVAMAAFGAFAFNGQKPNSFRVDEGAGCRDVNVACANSGNAMCRVETNKGVYQVWSDLSCNIPVFHTSILPIQEEND